MPAPTHRRAQLLRVRGAWIGVAFALLALVVVVLARRGAGEADFGRLALAPGAEVEASGSERTTEGAELDFEVPAPNSAAATVEPMPDAPRKARVAARVQPVAPIVVGFEVTDAIHGRPLNAWRATVGFELTRGDERWPGRRVDYTGPRWNEATIAFGNGRKDSRSGADEFVYVELDPATPRGGSFAYALELKFEAVTEGGLELLPRATYRGQGKLTLSGEPYQRLSDVPCRRIDAWAAGAVVAGPHFELQDARVELIELPASLEGESHTLGGDVLAATIHTTDPAAASAPVQADRTFSVPGPAREALPRMRLRLVLADGQSFLSQGTHAAFKGGIVLHLDASRTATGRLLFRGAPATGLARLHAEQAGAQVGQVRLDRDGAFTLGNLPYGALDIVIESGRPGGELARFPLASLTGNVGTSKLDLGVIEVAGHAEVMELEVVDRNGTPAATSLRWSGPRSAGSTTLQAREVHTLLLAPVVRYDMTLVPSPPAEPIALVAKPGRVRVVVGE